MTDVLTMTFLASNGAKKSLSLTGVDPAISPLRVRQAMNQIAAAGIISRAGVSYYVTAYSAKLVSTERTVITDLLAN
ncbi:DUF2922 domain-containing protein [Lacticaseibacillus nasuensis]|uniref:Uncharacterized protein n=1 Tax=Lacticaseibacillus nasuensis JCM 17158 TaxID=1291734 RepID=A0A0R1JS01_9LACO|nr:DUF2922 domain-containing protein [Lacticaseibacillus nasuensis]KRK74096.1 hypothetical protein FD02_GL001420 [Lacticaseibacillus nasuensis JCM 17158]